MSWLSDFSSALGVPVGRATLATAIYLASIAAEREARGEALREIARVIQDPTWTKEFRPRAVVKQIFNYTFGKNHLSWICVRRSVYATVAFTVSFGLRFVLETKGENIGLEDIGILLYFFVCLISDYIALWKTRLIINVMQNSRDGLSILIMLSDVLLSLVIAGIFLALIKVRVDYDTFGEESDTVPLFLYHLLDWIMWGGFRAVFTGGGDYFPVTGILICSTLMTSVWAVITFISSSLLNLIRPLRSFISWFFPVAEHPIRAIGAVAGLLVWAGSVLVAVV